MHIGDNFKSDFIGASDFGFHALHIMDANYSIDYIKTKILKQHNQNMNSNNPGTYSKQGVLHKTAKFTQPAAAPYGDSQNVMLNFKI